MVISHRIKHRIMVLSLSHLYALFITNGLLLLSFTHTSVAQASLCPTPPTITLAQYNQITANTTISQMQTILGGLGYVFGTDYVDLPDLSINTLAYTYFGTNQVGVAGQSVLVSSYAAFTFKALTQKLSFKIYFGLC